MVTFPGGADRIDDHSALDIGFTDERQQRAHTEIKALRQRKANADDANKYPPDQADGFIIEHDGLLRKLWLVAVMHFVSAAYSVASMVAELGVEILMYGIDQLWIVTLIIDLGAIG